MMVRRHRLASAANILFRPLDIVAARRANKTAAQRIRRALAKAAVQWRGEPSNTEAAAAAAAAE
jgi:hypothetical protein